MQQGQGFQEQMNFCLNITFHHFAHHVWAQNIKSPVILEYPRWEDFIKEVKKKKGLQHYWYKCIAGSSGSCFKKVQYIRENSPD